MAAERTPTPGVLSAAERRRIEDQFGVETAQVVRDHLIPCAGSAFGDRRRRSDLLRGHGSRADPSPVPPAE